MERVRKQDSGTASQQRVAQAKFTSRSRENRFAQDIDESPAMVAQRQKLDGLFGGAIQLVEDEEPLQGKFETAQRVEEEEPLQGKFEAVQRVEEEEPLQGKFETVQRVEDEEPLQGKFETVQRVEEEEPLQGKFEAASSVQRKGGAAKPNNTGLPDNLKSGIESLSGISMDNVKVHYNSSQPSQLNAHAYAQGTDIHVAPGQEHHLPHEAWHVVQQAEGRVQPTMQMKQGVPVNDDKSLEHEADVMGAKATSVGVMQEKSIGSDPNDKSNENHKTPILQKMKHEGLNKRTEPTGKWLTLVTQVIPAYCSVSSMGYFTLGQSLGLPLPSAQDFGHRSTTGGYKNEENGKKKKNKKKTRKVKQGGRGTSGSKKGERALNKLKNDVLSKIEMEGKENKSLTQLMGVKRRKV